MEIRSIPIQAFKPGTREVDVDKIFEVAAQEIHKTLPQAALQGMVFSGSCQALPRLDGALIFIFVEERGIILSRQVLRGTASVDTSSQTMDLSFWDVSDQHPSTDQSRFPGDRDVKEAAALAYQHIIQMGLCEGNITMTRLRDRWDVRCGPLENFIQKCRFEIINGLIKEKQE